MIHLAYPWLLPLAGVLLLLRVASRRRGDAQVVALDWPDLELIESLGLGRPRFVERIPWALHALAIVLIVVALARPQKRAALETVDSQGIDIVLCLDTSGSMQAEDLEPNRLEAARSVAKAFVRQRPADRIGLVVFGAVAFTQCPLTTDHDILQLLLDQCKIGMTRVDGTAIGTALMTCINRLSATPGKSKVIVLVTDGRSNTGEVDPPTAAALAAAKGVRIYAIGVGARGAAPVTIRDSLGFLRRVEIQDDLDEEGLTRIATKSGGRFYRATDNQGLLEVFSEINRMEKTVRPDKVAVEYQELYPWFLLPALLALALASVLELTLLQEVP